MASSSRTTVRVNLNSLKQMAGASSAPPPPPAGTIYYVQTSTPHIHDMSMFGPFHCLEALVPSVRRKLAQTSPAGLLTFDEMLSSADGHISFEHILAPLEDGNKMMIQVITRCNSEVAASLPGPVWNVVCSEILNPFDPASPKLKSFDIVGSFISPEAANEAVREVVASKARGMRAARQMVERQDDGATNALVMNSSACWIVESKLDDGVGHFDDDY